MIDTKITINTDLYNLDNIKDEILSELEEIRERCEFVLNKYTWDRKKPYSVQDHDYTVQDTRDTLAVVLLNIRAINKLK